MIIFVCFRRIGRRQFSEKLWEIKWFHFHYCQASLYVPFSTFSITGKEYICRVSSSFRQITSLDLDNTPRLKLYQKISSLSSNLVSLWPHSIRSNITLYKTLFVNNLWFSANDFTTIRRSNDVCVLYESRKNQYSNGFIVFIGHLGDKNEIYLLLNKVNISFTTNSQYLKKKFQMHQHRARHGSFWINHH